MHFNFPGAASIFCQQPICGCSQPLAAKHSNLPIPCLSWGAPYSSSTYSPYTSPVLEQEEYIQIKNNKRAQTIAKPISQEQFWFLQLGLAQGWRARGDRSSQPQPFAACCLTVQPHLANLTQLPTVTVVAVSQGQEIATGQGESPL